MNNEEINPLNPEETDYVAESEDAKKHRDESFRKVAEYVDTTISRNQFIEDALANQGQYTAAVFRLEMERAGIPKDVIEQISEEVMTKITTSIHDARIKMIEDYNAGRLETSGTYEERGLRIPAADADQQTKKEAA